jgi:hypothetical protein
VRTRGPGWAPLILIALALSLAACDGAITGIVDRDPPADPGGVQSVIPVPGQLDVQPIAIDRFIAEVADRHVTVTAFFTTGVEPCNVLDSVVVERRAGQIDITLIEGHGPGDVACRSIAVTKSTAIDLGDLEPGSYRITDSGHAPTVDVVVD